MRFKKCWNFPEHSAHRKLSLSSNTCTYVHIPCSYACLIPWAVINCPMCYVWLCILTFLLPYLSDKKMLHVYGPDVHWSAWVWHLHLGSCPLNLGDGPHLPTSFMLTSSPPGLTFKPLGLTRCCISKTQRFLFSIQMYICINRIEMSLTVHALCFTMLALLGVIYYKARLLNVFSRGTAGL